MSAKKPRKVKERLREEERVRTMGKRMGEREGAGGEGDGDVRDGES